jgi:benzodiazapine receptor
MAASGGASLPTGRGQNLLGLAAFLLICFAVAALGSWLTVPALPGWYANLNRPTWTPPNQVFAPVWSILYALMAVAAWLVWRQRERTRIRVALTLFGVQLACNAAWSWLFFDLKRPGLAFIDIVLLWLAILATLVTFLRVRRTAGLLLVPYLLWVSYAAALNFSLWRLNS